MISFGKAASSHSCLIPLKTAYKKKKEENCSGRSRVRSILLTCIQLLLLQFLHAIGYMPTNFALFRKPLNKVFLKTTQSRDQLSINIPCKFQEHWKQRRLLNRASNITNCSLRFWVYKCASSLFTGIVFKFHMHVHEYKQGYIRDVKLNSLN